MYGKTPQIRNRHKQLKNKKMLHLQKIVYNLVVKLKTKKQKEINLNDWNIYKQKQRKQ